MLFWTLAASGAACPVLRLAGVFSVESEYSGIAVALFSCELFLRLSITPVGYEFPAVVILGRVF